MDEFAKKGTTRSLEKMDSFFRTFDRKQTGYLDFSEFHDLLGQVFSHHGKPYPIESQLQRELFEASDIDRDGKISKKEFELSWKSWLSEVLDPVTALVVVDVQNDFITGSLALCGCPAGEDGADVIPVINKLLTDVTFDVVVYTQDWHPPDHISFHSNIAQRKFHSSSKVKREEAKPFDEVVFDVKPRPMEQILWPAHCVQKSHGAQLHDQLKVHEPHIIVKKGYNPDVDSYSAFWDNGKLNQTNLLLELNARRVTDVYVCGLAYDVCVGFTATHSAEHGFRTVFVEDASRGVAQHGMQNVKKSLIDKDVLFVQSNEVADLVAATNRPAVLGNVSLRNFRDSLKVSEPKQ